VTQSIVSIGSKLQFSTDNVHFTAVAQLRKAKPVGSKQTIVDQTNILTDPSGDAPYAARVSAGELQMDGVLSPQDSSQLTLGQLHVQRTLAWWKVLLSDGITVWTFQGFVSEYLPFDLDVMKAVAFSAKIRISGALTGPLGAA
jgi:hypothetical protein